jgi:hypothetical protein
MGAKAQRDLRGIIEHETIAWIAVGVCKHMLDRCAAD